MKSLQLAILFLIGSATISIGQRPFITTWKTDNPGSSCNSCITIPTAGSGYNYEVDWDNDGVYEESGITGDVTHDFGSPGIYTIRLKGNFPRIYFKLAGDRSKVVELNQWGDNQWISMESAFEGCDSLIYSAIDGPDLSKVSSMSNMFRTAELFNGDIGNWDVSTITDMSYCFSGARSFDKDIGSWDVSSVENMHRMFFISSFNQPLNNWDVSKVRDMGGMFELNNEFNQAIENWDVSNVKDMSSMFSLCRKFNSPIGSWDVSNVTTMSNMFNGADSFNQDLSNWDVSSCMDMNEMFKNTIDFNGDLGFWDVSNVKDMTGMFRNTIAFNQDLGSWQLSEGVVLFRMFRESKVFNQDLSNWNVSTAKNLNQMFWDAEAFDQNLGSWQIPVDEQMLNTLSNSGMSCENYSASLIGWATNSSTPNNVELGADELVYNTPAEVARQVLEGKGWTITGDSLGVCSTTTNDLEANTIELFPNPVGNVLNINKSIPYIIVRDNFGRVVIEGYDTAQLNLTSFHPGLYIVECFDDNKHLISQHKMIKL